MPLMTLGGRAPVASKGLFALQTFYVQTLANSRRAPRNHSTLGNRNVRECTVRACFAAQLCQSYECSTGHDLQGSTSGGGEWLPSRHARHQWGLQATVSSRRVELKVEVFSQSPLRIPHRHHPPSWPHGPGCPVRRSDARASDVEHLSALAPNRGS